MQVNLTPPKKFLLLLLRAVRLHLRSLICLWCLDLRRLDLLLPWQVSIDLQLLKLWRFSGGPSSVSRGSEELDWWLELRRFRGGFNCACLGWEEIDSSLLLRICYLILHWVLLEPRHYFWFG